MSLSLKTLTIFLFLVGTTQKLLSQYKSRNALQTYISVISLEYILIIYTFVKRIPNENTIIKIRRQNF